MPDDSVMVARYLLGNVDSLSQALSVRVSSWTLCNVCGAVTEPSVTTAPPVFTLRCAPVAHRGGGKGRGGDDDGVWGGASDGDDPVGGDVEGDDGSVAWAFARSIDTAGGGLPDAGHPGCFVCGAGSPAVWREVRLHGDPPPEALFLQLLPGPAWHGDALHAEGTVLTHRTFDEEVALDVGRPGAAAPRYLVRSVVGKTGGLGAGHFVCLVRQDAPAPAGGSGLGLRSSAAPATGCGGGAGGAGGSSLECGSGESAVDGSSAAVQWWLLDDAACTRVRASSADRTLPLFADPSLQGLLPCLLGLELKR